MRTRLRHVWEVLTSSYWFVPSLMVAAAVGLAFGILAVDTAWINDEGVPDWLYSGTAGGARDLLATVAGSIITVAGVVFSIAIVTLTQASVQFGPRLLRNFMRDTGNQVVLGTFLATFLYCLLVLRRVYGGEDNPFVPHLSVSIAVLLAIASIVVLIYYIHHVSTTLQAPHVVAAVGKDLSEAMVELYPDGMGDGGPPPEDDEPARLLGHFERHALPICSTANGYVQAVDGDTLIDLARRHDLLVRLDRRPGQYAIAGDPLMYAWPADRLCPRLQHKLRRTFIVGPNRTHEQDVEFAIHQMVETAVRALSPGINDPFTAITCIDWLGAALSRLARSDLPEAWRYDADGRLRVVTRLSTYSGLIDAAFNMIRQYGRGSPAVMIHLLEVIGEIARQARQDDQRHTLRRHLEMVHRAISQTVNEDYDRQVVDERYRAALANIDNPA